uniref:AMP-dependent synthetase/ligase domain-containing protein n=1 Tax=Mycena chlorophos TaxID=658473 RepID=A0ABQ0L9T0_MYCCL|nr:predicted protein [Mycena chlorophos]
MALAAATTVAMTVEFFLHRIVLLETSTGTSSPHTHPQPSSSSSDTKTRPPTRSPSTSSRRAKATPRPRRVSRRAGRRVGPRWLRCRMRASLRTCCKTPLGIWAWRGAEAAEGAQVQGGGRAIADCVALFPHLFSLLSNLQYHLFCGMTVVVMPKFDFREFLAAIKTYEVNPLGFLPPIAMAPQPVVEQLGWRNGGILLPGNSARVMKAIIEEDGTTRTKMVKMLRRVFGAKATDHETADAA